MTTSHRPWLGFVLEEALKLGVTDAEELVRHANPDALVAQLPRELTTQLIARALGAGTLSPASVLETAPPAVLAEHLTPEILWRCLSEAATRARLTEAGTGASAEGKRWLATALEKALETKLVTPPDVLRFVPPAEFVRNAPLPVMAEMIRTGLTRGQFDPTLVLTHLTPQVLTESVSCSLVWACVQDAVGQKLLGQPVLGEESTGEVSLPPERLESTQPAARIEPVLPRAKSRVFERSNPAPRIVEKAKAQVAKPADKQPMADFELPHMESEWGGTDDLDVLEEAPLPPPPVARRG